MIVVDARVDDSDADAATRKPELALRDVGAGLLQRGDQVHVVAGLILLRAKAHVQDGIDGQHAGDRSELCAVARCRADGDAVPEIFEAPAVGIPNTASPRRRMEVGFLAIEHGRRRALNAWRTGQIDETQVPRLVVEERNELRPRRDLLGPPLLADQAHADNRRLVKAIGRHLHAVPHASRPDEADGAGADATWANVSLYF